MAHSDARKGPSLPPRLTNCRESAPSLLTTCPESTLSLSAAAGLILHSPTGSVLALSGIDSESLRFALDHVDSNPQDRRVLFTRIEPAPTTDATVEQVVGLLAQTALRLWPIWYTDVSFAECRGDTLGRLAAVVSARNAANKIAGLSLSWAESATRLARVQKRI
jgi:hypothetical protein